MCFTRRNTLFHQRKHSVSSRETLCFFKRNTLFHKGKQIGNTSANLGKRLYKSRKSCCLVVLLSCSLVDLLSFEISLCDFANFAREKRNLIREVLCRKKKFSYLCKQDFSDNKKAFLLIFGNLKLGHFQTINQINKERTLTSISWAFLIWLIR